jgi:tetratricopeptide (TPR) repeat protein
MTDQNNDPPAKQPSAQDGDSRSRKQKRAQRRALQFAAKADNAKNKSQLDAVVISKDNADGHAHHDGNVSSEGITTVNDSESKKQFCSEDTLDNLPLVTDGSIVARNGKPDESNTLDNLPIVQTNNVDLAARQTAEPSSEDNPETIGKSTRAPNKVHTELKIAGSYPGVHVPQPGSSKRVSAHPPAVDNTELANHAESDDFDQQFATDTQGTEANQQFPQADEGVSAGASQQETADRRSSYKNELLQEAELHFGNENKQAEGSEFHFGNQDQHAEEPELHLGNQDQHAEEPELHLGNQDQHAEEPELHLGNQDRQLEETALIENADPNEPSSPPSEDLPSSTGSGIAAMPAPQRPVGPLPKSVPHLLRKTGTFAAADPPNDGSTPPGSSPVNPKSGRHTTTLTRIVFSESLSHQEETIGSMKSPVEKMKKSITSKKDNVKYNFATTKDLFKLHPIISSLGVASAIILLLSLGALTQGLSKTFYNAGVASLQAQQYDDAIASFDRALLLHGDFTEAMLNRGNSYFALGDFDKAWSDYNSVLQSSSTNAQALKKRAATNLELGKNEDAVRDYQQLAILAPDELKSSSESLTNLGAAYFAQEQYGQALEQFNKSVALFPHEVRPHLKRAMCYEGLKQYDKAAQDYNEVLKLEPDNVRALVNRARCFQETHNFSDDLGYLTRALAIQPKNAQANKYLGIHYARLHNSDKALAALDKAIASNKTDAQSYQERAMVLTEKGDVNKALLDLQALKSLPGFETDAKYYQGLAKLHMSATNFTGAVEDLNQLMAADPEQKSIYLLKRAECYAGMKDYKKALADCTAVLQEKPNDAAALLSRGRYSLMAGNRMPAIEDYSQAIKNNPRNAGAYIARGDVYLLQKQASSAADDFKHALALQPKSLEVKEKLASAISQINQIAGSAVKPIAIVQTKQTTLSKAALDEIAKMDSSALMQKGYAALKKGDTDFALAALSRAVSQKPNDPSARQYLFYAMTSAGEADAAVEQWNVLEKLGVENIASDLKCAQAIARCGNKQIGGGCWEHMISKYATDEGALIRIAKTCAACDYKDKAIEACDKGLEHASDLSNVRELNKLRIALSNDSGESSAQPGSSQPSSPGKYIGR